MNPKIKPSKSDLPTDTIISILEKLPVNNVGKILENIKLPEGSENYLWWKLFNRDFGPVKLSPANWKQLYKDKFLRVGDVYSMGSNGYGQLGLSSGGSAAFAGISSYEYESTPTKIKGLRGKYASCAYDYTMVLTEDGTIYGFGNILHKQLSIESHEKWAVKSPVKINDFKCKMVACQGPYVIFLDINDDVYIKIFKYGSREDKLIKINGIKGKYIACSEWHVVIITKDGSIYSYGDNEHGQLGLSPSAQDQGPLVDFVHKRNWEKIPNIKGKYVACGSNHTVILDEDGYCYSMGDNRSGQLGLSPSAQGHGLLGETKPNQSIPTRISDIKFKHIACGRNHTVLIDENGIIYSTGGNGFGQLGLGDFMDRYSLTKIMLNLEPLKGKFVACGSNHTMIIAENGDIYGCGFNESGKLGIGETNGIFSNQYVSTPRKVEKFKGQFIACGEHHTIIISE